MDANTIRSLESATPATAQRGLVNVAPEEIPAPPPPPIDEHNDAPRAMLSVESRPEYQVLLAHIRSHLQLVPPLPTNIGNNIGSHEDSWTSFFTTLFPEAMATSDLDLYVIVLALCIGSFDAHKRLQGRNRAAVNKMIENGLISHLGMLFALFLGHDDRPWKELTSNTGWVAVLRLAGVVSRVSSDREKLSDAHVERFGLHWTNDVGSVYAALIGFEDLWSFMSQSASSEWHALDVCRELERLIHPHLLYVDFWLRSGRTGAPEGSQGGMVTRFAVHLLAKLRHFMTLDGNDHLIDTNLSYRTARTLDYLLTLVMTHHPDETDVLRLTGLPLDAIIHQTFVLLPSPDKLDKESIECATAQLRPLGTLLGVKNPPKDWIAPISKSRIFSQLVERARSTVLRWMAKDRSEAGRTLATEMSSTDPETSLRTSFSILDGISVLAERYSVWELYAEMSNPEALSLAEIVAFVDEGDVKCVYWSIFLSAAAIGLHGKNPVDIPVTVVKNYRASMRAFATRAQIEIKCRPGAFPALGRHLRAKFLPGLILLDCTLEHLYGGDSINTPNSSVPSSGPSSVSVIKGPMAQNYDRVKTQSVWEMMYNNMRGVKGHEVVARLSSSPRASDVCAAVGCLSTTPPQTMCGACHKVYYCGKACQRRSWRWHKPICRQNTTSCKS